MKAGDKFYVWEIHDPTDRNTYIGGGVESTYERAERVGMSVCSRLTNGEKYRVSVREEMDVETDVVEDNEFRFGSKKITT